MFKKVLAGLATVALALGFVAATAAPASAHHNTINAVITCTDDYKYKVDWSVTNSENLTEEITASSDTDLVPVGEQFANKETKVFTEYFDAPTSKTLTLSAKWSNNNTNTSEGKIKKNDFPNCEPNHVPVTICHATPPDTAAQGWEDITIDDDAIVKSAHNEQHDFDIIPSFNYWEQVDDVWTLLNFPGKNLDTVFSGIPGSAILAAGCTYTTVPTEPVFTPAECTAPGQAGEGSYFIPSQTGVRFEVRIDGGDWETVGTGTYYEPVGTVIEVKAFGDPDWVGLTGKTSWEYTVPSPGDCIYEATPVAPDVTEITECGEYGSVIPKQTPGVVYEFTIGDGTEGAWEIKATPAANYKFVGDQVVYFSGNVGEYTDCAEPVAPQVTTITECDQFGSVVMPKTEGVVYTLTVGDGKQGAWEVTATPADGYSFIGEQSVVYSGNLGTYTDCSDPLPAIFVNEECVELVDELPIDSASAELHFALVGTLVAGTFEIPTTEGVQYTVSINGGPYTDYSAGVYEAANGDLVSVKAVALPGYTLTGETQWDHTFVAFEGECDPPTLGEVFPAASATNQTCTASGTIDVLPTEHVIYSIDGVEVTQASTPKAPGTYTVTAVTDSPEYGIFGPDEWELTIAPVVGPCTTTALLASTGSFIPLLGVSAAVGLLAIGGMMLVARRRNAA